MIRVYHLTNSRHNYPLTDFEATKRWIANGYEAVAEIDTDDLEIAWFHTNHIDKPWWEDKKVTLIKESRSSMVGDVLQLNDSLYRVCAKGFSKFSPVDGLKISILAGGES